MLGSSSKHSSFLRSFQASSSSSWALALFFSSIVACGEVFTCCMEFLLDWDLVVLRFSGGEHPVAPVVSVPLADIPLNNSFYDCLFEYSSNVSLFICGMRMVR